VFREQLSKQLKKPRVGLTKLIYYFNCLMTYLLCNSLGLTCIFNAFLFLCFKSAFEKKLFFLFA
jgi:hypothetical protein